MDNVKLYIEYCDSCYQNWKDTVQPLLLQAQTFWTTTLQK